VHTVAGGLERVLSISDAHADVVALRRPDPELHGSIIERGRAKATLPWIGLYGIVHLPKVPNGRAGTSSSPIPATRARASSPDRRSAGRLLAVVSLSAPDAA
jgi:hypothetical protein